MTAIYKSRNCCTQADYDFFIADKHEDGKSFFNDGEGNYFIKREYVIQLKRTLKYVCEHEYVHGDHLRSEQQLANDRYSVKLFETEEDAHKYARTCCLIQNSSCYDVVAV